MRGIALYAIKHFHCRSLMYRGLRVDLITSGIEFFMYLATVSQNGGNFVIQFFKYILNRHNY